MNELVLKFVTIAMTEKNEGPGIYPCFNSFLSHVDLCFSFTQTKIETYQKLLRELKVCQRNRYTVYT